VEYTALSPHFDEVEDGEEVPEYEVWNDDGEVRFERID